MEQIPAYTIETIKASDASLKDFDFLRFEYFSRDIEHLRSPHRHHFYTFILVTAGTGSHAIDFTDYDLTPGRLFLIAPGQVHAWNELNHVQGYVVFFTDSFAALAKGRKIISDWPLFRSHQPCYYDLSREEEQHWTEAFVQMEGELRSADEFSRDAIFYSLSGLLVRASRLAKSNFTMRTASGHDFLFVFQELIEENFLKLKTPKEYASLMNITPNYLNALCKKKSGKSAGQLIRQRVLLEAKRLLAHTHLTAAEIAYKLNFEDNSYFGRFFKKYTGVTPESFRLTSRHAG